MKLIPGKLISYLDCDNAGKTFSPIGVARLVRARGRGMLLETETGHRFRVPRASLVRVVPEEEAGEQEKEHIRKRE